LLQELSLRLFLQLVSYRIFFIPSMF
jgi:hypothetical protein